MTRFRVIVITEDHDWPQTVTAQTPQQAAEVALAQHKERHPSETAEFVSVNDPEDEFGLNMPIYEQFRNS